MNKKIKICVYAIAKNEAKHVYRWYDSVKEADSIIVVDTGSEDSTVNKLQKCAGVEVFHYNESVFRFDHARNQALTHAIEKSKGEPTIFFWCDLDETVERGWCDRLRAASQVYPEATAFNVMLLNGGVSYNRLAAHTFKYRWQYPAHEVLMPECDEIQCFVDISVNHVPDLDKPRNYLDLLQLGATEYKDSRSYRYYARELYYNNLLDQAIEFYQKAAQLEENQLLLSEIYTELGNAYSANEDASNAKQSYIYGAWTAPYIREGWGSLVLFCFRSQMYAEALSALQQMCYVAAKPTHTVMVFDPYYTKWWTDQMFASCYYGLGNIELAKMYIANALAANPHDAAIQSDFATIHGLVFDKLEILESSTIAQ